MIEIISKLYDIDETWIDNLICELGLEFDWETKSLFTPFNDVDVNLAIKKLEEIIDRKIIEYDKLSVDWYHYKAKELIERIWDEGDNEL